MASQSEENKGLVLEAMTALFQRRDASVIDRLYAEDHVQHNPNIADKSEAVWGDAAYQAKLHSWPVGWLPQWIPIGDANTHQKVYLDLSPAPAGMKGQLIYTQEDTLVNELAADSFTDYLERFLAGVESGKLVPQPNAICWSKPGGPALVSSLGDAGF